MILGLVIIVSALLCVFLIRRQFNYWERKKIAFIQPSIPFGNLKAVVKTEKSMGDAINDLYHQTNKPFIGIYLLFRPAILVRDPELVKHVLVTSFSHFHDHGVFCDVENDPMSANLFSLSGAEWKALRSKLTPAFSSGKLKVIFHTVQANGQKLQLHLEKSIADKNVVELKDLCSRFVVDVIGSTIFGVESNSINHRDDGLFRIGRQLAGSRTKFLDGVRVLGSFLCPSLMKFLRIKSLPAYVSNYMLDLVKKTIEYRESNEVAPNDLMQLLLNLRNTGSVDGSSLQSGKSLSVEEIASNIFLFYIAGSESSSSTISFCIHEISQNVNLMAEVVTEIDKVLKKYNGEVTYEGIMEMRLVEKCAYETMRKYPGLPIMNRICTKDFPVPDSNVVIKKGTAVIIPVLGMQTDPENFPDPMKFDPYRFDGQNADCKNAFFPFGDGPRNCIGW